MARPRRENSIGSIALDLRQGPDDRPADPFGLQNLRDRIFECLFIGTVDGLPQAVVVYDSGVTKPRRLMEAKQRRRAADAETPDSACVNRIRASNRRPAFAREYRGIPWES